jgi:hypothetical protein
LHCDSAKLDWEENGSLISSENQIVETSHSPIESHETSEAIREEHFHFATIKSENE